MENCKVSINTQHKIFNTASEIIPDLSSYQHIAYKICLVIFVDELDADLGILEVGPIVHSHWLIFECRILQFKVYFPTWFHIKLYLKALDSPYQKFL